MEGETLSGDSSVVVDPRNFLDALTGDELVFPDVIPQNRMPSRSF